MEQTNNQTLQSKRSNNIQVDTSVTDDFLRISITPHSPPQSCRTPTTICCVLDVSDSMGSEADSNGLVSQSEKYRLSVLDICKHAIKMVVSTLRSQDTFSLVVFGSKAETVFALQEMSDQNKIKAEHALENLDAQGSTNLWAGIKLGLDTLKNPKNDPNHNRNKWVFVLTDGQPDSKQLVQKGLNEYRQINKDQFCQVSTFAFGQEADSLLMMEIAQQFNGMFSHIGDCTLIATSFANALSNALTSSSTDLQISVKPVNGYSFNQPIGISLLHSNNQIISPTNNENNEILSVSMGVMTFQQKRDLIIPIKTQGINNNEIAIVNITYSDINQKQVSVKTFEMQVKDIKSKEDDANEIFRTKIIEETLKHLNIVLADKNQLEKSKLELLKIVEMMEEMLEFNDRHFDGLYKDLSQTILKSFSNYTELTQQGIHTILSLIRAHQIQQCNTFKYPGVQHYGKAIFQSIRDVADKAFCSLPPPKPYSQYEYYQPVNNNNNNNDDNANDNKNDNNYDQSYNMADYHNYGSGGCVFTNSLVLLADHTYKRVQDIVQGDVVITDHNDTTAKVICVVKSKFQEQQQLIQLSKGLIITSKHPVKINGSWQYPYKVSPAMANQQSLEEGGELFQFVLDQQHTMIIDGIQCICLAHGLQGEIVGHDYLSTQKVVEDLKTMKGWENGRVEIEGRIKDRETGKVIAFIQKRNH